MYVNEKGTEKMFCRISFLLLKVGKSVKKSAEGEYGEVWGFDTNLKLLQKQTTFWGDRNEERQRDSKG